MQDGIVGVWLLRAFHVEDVDTGQRSEPFGVTPRGVIMFHSGGRMVALLTPRNRAVPLTEADRAAAFGQLVACSGRYRLEPGRFVIDVDVAWFEPWVGGAQVRGYRITDDRLDIVSAPTRLPKPGAADATVIATLSWVREATEGKA